MSVIDTLTALFEGAYPEKGTAQNKKDAQATFAANKDHIQDVLGSLVPPATPASAEPSSFDVGTSTGTATANGDVGNTNIPGSVMSAVPNPVNYGDQTPAPAAPIPPITDQPALNAPPVPAAPAPEETNAASVPSSSQSPASKPAAPTTPAPTSPDLASVLSNPTSSDNDKRNAMLADVQRQKKLGLIPNALGGIADALGNAAKPFGGQGASGVQNDVIAEEQKLTDQEKANFETKLKNDPSSETSKAYRQMVLQIAPNLANNPDFQTMSAQSIGDKLPLIDTMMKAKASEDAKKASLAQSAAMRDLNVGLRNDQQQSKLEQENATRLAKVYSNRSGGLGLQDAKVNAAIHSRELIEGARDAQGNVHINQITSPELAMSLASIVSNGNAPALETMKEMTPESLQAYVKSKIGYIFGKPVDVLPKAWVDSLTHQLDRQGLTSEALRNQEMEALKGLRPSKLDPKVAQTQEDSMSNNMPSYSQRYGLKPIDLKHPQNNVPQTTGQIAPQGNARKSPSGYSYTVSQ